MIEVEPGSVEEHPSAARPPIRHDFSVVTGFQVVAAEDQVAAQKQGGDQAWRDALRAELEGRAARFHQAVDTAIVLSSDGIVRWLGDPVARLAPGPNTLTPGAVVLADDALSAASQEMVKNRIDLWLAATARRLLGPLFALETIQEGSTVVRDLAGRLSRSLGILEREPIRRQIKALPQDERAQLRKHGVRFGAYYIFLPALIKPAARTLALHLWGLHAPPGAADATMRVLGALASSGRTSLPFEGELSRESYRIAGYRPCGERIVRIDVFERLAGIIRSAIAGGPEGVAAGLSGPQKSKGFVITGEMTSLTGCSGEHFGSILRSMDFESVPMSRSDFFGSPSVSESTNEREPLASTEPPETTAQEQRRPTAASEEGTSVDELAVGSSIASLVGDGLEPASTPDTAADASRSDASAAEPGEKSRAGNEGARNDSAGDPFPPDMTAETSRPDVLAAEPGTVSQASSKGGAENDEPIVVWRPERRAPARRGAGRKTRRDQNELAASEQSKAGAPRRSDNVGRGPTPAPQRTRNKNRSEALSTAAAADARKAAEGPPPGADQSANVRADEKHRQAATNRDMPRSHSGPGRQARAKVDPSSPFAKLLELRSLLERQANKRP